MTAHLCEKHFDKARRSLEGDKREWSATPVNRPKPEQEATDDNMPS